MREGRGLKEKGREDGGYRDGDSALISTKIGLGGDASVRKTIPLLNTLLGQSHGCVVCVSNSGSSHMMQTKTRQKYANKESVSRDI